MDWWTQNKDAITAIGAAIGAILAIGGIIWAVIKWGFLRGWQKKLRIDVKVFEVITDPAALLPKLFATENDNSPVADHRIPYQRRDPNRDLQAELKAALNRSRYLLITAPTGYGKTREAGVLAQTMMLEGWRVLRIKTGWLDVPKALPEELNNNRSRILILLDDLNGLFSTGERTQSPRAEQIPLLSEASYHDRLLKVLDTFEGMCTESEIRVIATARSEAEQWRLLNFDKNDTLWKRFERIEIPEPASSAIVNLLEDTVKQADLKADPADFEPIARKSDGTYRNIVINLQRWYKQNKPVSKDDLTETLQGSWQDVYYGAVKKIPAVKFVYDAIDILLQAGIDLFPFLVEPTAVTVWGGNSFQKFLRRREIRRAMRYLVASNIIRQTDQELRVSDGQIEAKPSRLSWLPYAEWLTKLLLDAPQEKSMSSSLFGLATVCYFQEKTILSYQLINRFIKLNPNSAVAYYNLGVLLEKLERYAEAEDAFRQAIAKDPNDAAAYSNLGNLLQKLGRYAEAEDAYRQAIAKDPNDAQAYSNLGVLLKKLERYAEAEDP
ncbi:MAG TPA: tetratricopeptide repeat protein [Anaerolineales bacterium]|nr:tetratricopeptide repeat protein [Anaerolineales bacterium]